MQRRSRRKREKPAPPPARRSSEKLAQILDIPSTAVSNAAQIELLGNREAVIEGCKGILEYSDTLIKLNTAGMVLKISGRSLRIKVMTASGIVIEGFFTAMEFIT